MIAIDVEKELQKADARVNGIRMHGISLSEKERILIANLWSAYIGTEIKPIDVDMLLVMVEIAKNKGNHNNTKKRTSCASCMPATVEKNLNI